MLIIRFNQVRVNDIRSLLSLPKPQIEDLTGPMVQNVIVDKIMSSGYLTMRTKVFLKPKEIKSIANA